MADEEQTATVRCISCGYESEDAARFTITVRGPQCDGCQRSIALQRAEQQIRAGAEMQAFEERHVGRPVVSIALAAICLVHVLIGLFDEKLWLKLIYLGSVRHDAVVGGEVYRLITSLFLHGGFGHWLGNSLFLLYVGWLGERFLGRGWFLLAFFVSGVGGSLVSMFVNPHPAGSIGASGAVYGLFSCVFVEALQAKARRPIRVFRKLFGAFIIFMLLNEVSVYFMEGIAGSLNIGHWAHLGGLLVGALYGFVVPMYKGPAEAPPGDHRSP